LHYGLILIVFSDAFAQYEYFSPKTVIEVIAFIPLRGIHALFLVLTVQ